jgi:hypothetical protein
MNFSIIERTVMKHEEASEDTGLLSSRLKEIKRQNFEL